MSQRYTKIFSLSERQNFGDSSCPVTVKAGSLLYDNEKKRMVSQIKFRNTSTKRITSILVNVIAYDATDTKINGAWGFEYKNLIANPGDDFGETVAVPMADNNTKRIEVDVISVRFSNGSKWSKLKEQVAMSSSAVKTHIADSSREAGDKALSTAKEARDIAAAGVMKVGEGVIIGGNILFKIAVITLSILVFLALLCIEGVALTYFSLGKTTADIVAVTGFGLAAVLAFPVFGSLIAKKTKTYKWRIVRWVSIVMIVVITCIGITVTNLQNDAIYDEINGIWICEEVGERHIYDFADGLVLVSHYEDDDLVSEKVGIFKYCNSEVRILNVIGETERGIRPGVHKESFEMTEAEDSYELANNRMVLKKTEKLSTENI